MADNMAPYTSSFDTSATYTVGVPTVYVNGRAFVFGGMSVKGGMRMEYDTG